jgi:hypothetical protein
MPLLLNRCEQQGRERKVIRAIESGYGYGYGYGLMSDPQGMPLTGNAPWGGAPQGMPLTGIAPWGQRPLRSVTRYTTQSAVNSQSSPAKNVPPRCNNLRWRELSASTTGAPTGCRWHSKRW